MSLPQTDYRLLFESMLTHLKQGVLVVDDGANVVFYNEPVTEIAGIEPEKAIGKNILEVFPDLTPETSTFYYVLRTGRPLIDHVQTYVNSRGKQVTIVSSTMPLTKNGKVVGAFELYRDFSSARELSDKILSLQRELYKKTPWEKAWRDNRAVYTFEDIVYQSSVMIDLINKARKVADSPSPLLVWGETGTGKELLVQAIHNASRRRDKPFIAQNCAALPKTLLEGILFGTTAGSFTGAKDRPGLFELADGGTLFLDEINAMDVELQAKLLRAVQDGVIRRIGGLRCRVVDVRVIASANEDPVKAMKNRSLREDLYYRLSVIGLAVPPLRDRKEDIPLLVEHFIGMYNKQLGKKVRGVSRDAMQVLINYYWPGNVRQLKSTVESIMTFIEADVETVEAKHLPASILCCSSQEEEYRNFSPEFSSNAPSLAEAVDTFERNMIMNALLKAKGNCAEAARILRVPRQTLHNKMKKHAITKPQL
ncbi:MAG: sigma-54 interaction domain-containing protein [Bacillota bacterium]